MWRCAALLIGLAACVGKVTGDDPGDARPAAADAGAPDAAVQDGPGADAPVALPDAAPDVPDAASIPDAPAPPDASLPDAPLPDAAPGTPDARPPDGATSVPDARPPDAPLPPDASLPPDAALPPDARPPDASPPPPDAAPPVDAAPPPDAPTNPPLPDPSCNTASGGHASTPEPVFVRALTGTHEGWLGSPAVADLDGDGTREIVAPRDNRLFVWRPDGTVKWQATVMGTRIWAPPVVANFVGDSKLEVVVGARGRVYMFDAAGAVVQPFPVLWRDEIRAIAAGDLDDDGAHEIVAVTTNKLSANGQLDIIQAFRADGSVQPGFPPNTSGTSGCDSACYVHGGFDQNLALGPIDDDDTDDIFAPHDNAYMSWHRGDGYAFDAASIFRNRTKVPGIRGMLDYALAQQGFGDDDDLQAHFTNSAPAITDLDGDGDTELVVLGSVQNVAQDDREQGVVLFVLNRDGTRPPGWTVPFHVPEYLAGLTDPGNNIVGATNEIAVADLDPDVAGKDLVFAGFDGRMRVVGANKKQRWSTVYTTTSDVLTSGPVFSDLTKDGVPEVIFTTYSTDPGVSDLFILDAAGKVQRTVALPGRGAMPVPTVADIDGDGTLEILVSLKDPDGTSAILVYTIPDSGTNCLPWPTGRGNLRRTGNR